MFRLARNDAREVAADFGHDWPFKDENGAQEPELDKGDFYLLYSGASGKNRANIFQLLPKESIA